MGQLLTSLRTSLGRMGCGVCLEVHIVGTSRSARQLRPGSPWESWSQSPYSTAASCPRTSSTLSAHGADSGQIRIRSQRPVTVSVRLRWLPQRLELRGQKCPRLTKNRPLLHGRLHLPSSSPGAASLVQLPSLITVWFTCRPVLGGGSSHNWCEREGWTTAPLHKGTGISKIQEYGHVPWTTLRLAWNMNSRLKRAWQPQRNTCDFAKREK